MGYTTFIEYDERVSPRAVWGSSHISHHVRAEALEDARSSSALYWYRWPWARLLA